MIERTLKKLEPTMCICLLKKMAGGIHTNIEKNHEDFQFLRESTNLQMVRLRERVIVKNLLVVLNRSDYSYLMEGDMIADLKKKCSMKIKLLVDNLIVADLVRARNKKNKCMGVAF